VKRNTFVLAAVLLILGICTWAGWANFKYRRQAAERLRTATAPSAQGAPAADSADSATSYASPLRGKPAPTFILEDLSGKKVSLANYKGRPLVINFWATWCVPCRIETPWLIELRNQYAAQGLEVLGISMDESEGGAPSGLREEKQEVARFVQKTRIPYPVLIDGDSISRPYGGVDELPTSFFVNRHGTVVAAQLGVTSKDEIEGNIRKALRM
jgi:thiol-disulfide isomerase/thioredoxin